MKKNKKLFAILTLVAFMMTLMPVMAFAAEGAGITKVESSVSKNGDVVLTVTGTASEHAHLVDKLTGGSFALGTGDNTIGAGGTVDITIAATQIASATAGTVYYVGSSDGAVVESAYTGAKCTTFTLTQDIKDASAANAAAPTATAEYKDGQIVVAIEKTGADFKTADYEVKVGDTTKTGNLAEGKATVNFDYAQTGAAKEVEVTVTVDNDLAVTPKPKVTIPADSAQATEVAWNTYKATRNTANYNAFITAWKAQPLAADHDDYAKANIIAGASETNAAAYFTAEEAYKALVADPTSTTWNNFVTAYKGVASKDNLVTFIGGGVEKENLDDIATADDLEEVIAIVGGSVIPGGDDTTPVSGNASESASVIAADSTDDIEAAKTATQSSFPKSDTRYMTVNVSLKQANNDPAKTIDTTDKVVYVWSEEKAGQISDALVMENGSTKTTDGSANLAAGVYAFNQDYFNANASNGSIAVKAAFVRAGEYTLKASFTQPTAANVADITTFNGTVSSDLKTVTVKAPAADTREWVLDVTQKVDDQTTTIHKSLADGKTTDKKVTVAADTVATTKVTLTVKRPDADNNGKYVLVSNYPITLTTNSSNIELDKTSITSDYKGEASFNVAGLREGEYKVYVSMGDYEATLVIQVGATSANDIQLIKFPSNPIATDTEVDDYADIFRFQLTDANGNIVTDKNPKGAEKATAETPDSNQAKYVAIVSAPEGNKVKNADLYLTKVADKDYYTLKVSGGKKFEVEGDYEVRVVLDNGKSATVNFSVKKFDKAVSLHIEYPTQAVELNSTTAVPDIYFLDANNVMKKANNRVEVAATGYAVAGVVANGDDAGQIKVKNDEKYIGQTITVTAVSDKENLVASTTLTVADEAREVKLDTTRGQVNANNRVGFKVVDSTGNPVALGDDAQVTVSAVVANTGDADAKVSYSVAAGSANDLKANGTGIINLSSNKETTATVQIMVKVTTTNDTNSGDNNTGLSTTYYTGTETFTFGAEADKSVVMTIGSKEIVANNVPAAIDVAPFIKDNRTFVPFRALVEAFGAEVNYDEPTSTVTTKLDGKTVVLTVGSTVLTVNDETVTMDVAPYIVDDRVVVPVRFVGEAFGFTVEATQDENGATASVVFYQK